MELAVRIGRPLNVDAITGFAKRYRSATVHGDDLSLPLQLDFSMEVVEIPLSKILMYEGIFVCLSSSL